LQKFSRKPGGIPIDMLEFEFHIDTRRVNEILEGARDGAYVNGLHLEGARWEIGEDHLLEPEPMELYCKMPIIWFKPINRKGKAINPAELNAKKETYSCPTYYYPIRTGTIDRDSYIMAIELKPGEKPIEYWVKRGTALLMSLAE
jgi:dynein heavy chain